jgi:hypothetical protein
MGMSDIQTATTAARWKRMSENAVRGESNERSTVGLVLGDFMRKGMNGGSQLGRELWAGVPPNGINTRSKDEGWIR